jgi:hypothetical protein
MQTITKFGFDTTLATYLYGVPLYVNLLSRMNFDVDKEGNVLEHIIDNIKTAIKVAIIHLKKTGNETYIPKMKLALNSLLDYGTEENSSRMKVFLEDYEKDNRLIISPEEIEQDYLNLFIAEDFSPNKLQDLEMVMRRVRQIHEDNLS